MAEQDDAARLQRYLKCMERFSPNPEHLDELAAELKNPKALLAFLKELEEMLDRGRYWRWIIKGAKETGGWIAAVGGAIVMLYAAYSWITVPK